MRLSVEQVIEDYRTINEHLIVAPKEVVAALTLSATLQDACRALEGLAGSSYRELDIPVLMDVAGALNNIAEMIDLNGSSSIR